MIIKKSIMMNFFQKISNCYYLFRANQLAIYSRKTMANIDRYTFKHGPYTQVSKILNGKKKYDSYFSKISESAKTNIKPYADLENKIDDCTACWPNKMFIQYFYLIDMKKITSDHLISTAHKCGWYDLSNECWDRLNKIINSYMSVNGSLDSKTRTDIISSMFTYGNPSIKEIDDIQKNLQITSDYDGTDILEQNLYRKPYSGYVTYLMDNYKIDFWKLGIGHGAKPSACKAIIHELMMHYDRETVKRFIVGKDLLPKAYFDKLYQQIIPPNPIFYESIHSYNSYVELLESFNVCNHDEIKSKILDDVHKNKNVWIINTNNPLLKIKNLELLKSIIRNSTKLIC